MDKNIIAIIPARSGSKGFPNKNIAKIGEYTLLELAIKVALDCKVINDVFISTDSKEYEDIGLAIGAKSIGLRPEKLSSDEAKSIDVVIDLVEKLENKYEFIVLLQPTSPIRDANDIENMLRLINKKNADACVSICKLEEPHPYKLKKIDEEGYIESFIDGTTSETPRQLLPKVYSLNGAIYITRVSAMKKEKSFLPKKTLPYIMDTNINIDTEDDFIFLQAVIDKGIIKL